MLRYIAASAAALYCILLIFGDESRRVEVTRTANDDVTGFTLAGFSTAESGETVVRLESDISEDEAVALALRAGEVARANRERKALRGALVLTAAASNERTSGNSATLEEMWYVTGNRVNIRSGPGTGNAVVATLAFGDAAEILDDQNGWYQIKTADGGVSGWIFGKFLAETKPG